jgi:hypothetical protein
MRMGRITVFRAGCFTGAGALALLIACGGHGGSTPAAGETVTASYPDAVVTGFWVTPDSAAGELRDVGLAHLLGTWEFDRAVGTIHLSVSPSATRDIPAPSGASLASVVETVHGAMNGSSGITVEGVRQRQPGGSGGGGGGCQTYGCGTTDCCVGDGCISVTEEVEINGSIYVTTTYYCS